MKIDCAALQQTNSRKIGRMIGRIIAFTAIALGVVAILLPVRSFSQAGCATSHLKKPLIYQIGTVVHIHADGERPLLLALDALEQKYGWTVAYEDPPLPVPSAATNSPSLAHRRHPRAYNSREEGFSLEFKSGPTPDSVPDEAAVLAAVVDAYNESNAAAQFELRNPKQEAGRFEVVGVAARGGHDELVSQTPVLDLPITITKEGRIAKERWSVAQTITLICEQVSHQGKVLVTPVGTARFRESESVAVHGTEAPARTLLSRTLASVETHPHWRLLYDASARSYELNVGGPLP